MKKRDARILPRELSGLESKRKSRRPVQWLLRIFIALLLVGSAGLFVLFYLAMQQAVTLSLPTRVYQTDRQASVDYKVTSLMPEAAQETVEGEGQVYLSALAQTVDATFHYSYSADSAQDLAWSSQVMATVRIYETKGPDQLLYENSQVLSAPEVSALSAESYQIEQQAIIPIQDFQQQFQSFADQSPLAVRGELEIRLLVKTQAELPSGLVTIVDQPMLVLPLTNDLFTIEKQTQLKPTTLWRFLPYQVILTTVHPALFPAAAAFFLLACVLWLRLTVGRHRDPFEKQLARMQRRCRGRLMLIADKAWEPEWCITTHDFKTMVQTAKKLKHPVFCHIDRQGDYPVAYFYVYYGENNYCLTFKPEGIAGNDLEQPHQHEQPVPLPEIPTLPETPESSSTETSSEE